MAGGRVRVKNSDAILHNTHGFLGKPTVFNLALPNRDQMVDITKRLTRPGVVRVLCDAHPHMFAWMVVHDSPYVAVTDDRARSASTASRPAPTRSPCGTRGSGRRASTRTAARSTTSRATVTGT